MNIIHKAAAAAALVVTLGASLAQPASAQMLHRYGYHHPRQYRHANRLDHRAAVAASHGRYYRATRMRNHAAVIRSAARHGY